MTDTIIDDQDLSSVHYNGSWIRGGSVHEHDETVASSTKVGDFFTVSFFGNSISVYGTIDSTSAGVLTNYSVDNAPSEQFASQAGTGDTFNQQFWKSPALDVGQHQLVVTMVKVNNDSQPGEGTIWFDYFLVRDPTIRQQSLSKKLRTKEIVGGVVGGVLVLFIALAAFLLFRRRYRDKRRIKAQPFQLPKNEVEMQSPTSFHVGNFLSDANVGPISPFPFQPFHENSDTAGSGTTLTSAIPNTHPNSHGDLLRKSTLINMGRRQVSGRVYGTSNTATFPSSATTSGTVTESSDAHAITSPAQEPPSGLGKHQRNISTRRVPRVAIPSSPPPPTPPPPLVNNLNNGVSSLSALTPVLRSALSPTTPITLPTLTDSEEPLQHIDSGMRAIHIQTDLPTTRVELPPVYTPV